MRLEGENRRAARILIVDDEERIADLVTWFLRRSGHEAVHVHSFEAARRTIPELRPDLLLSDIELGAENARDELPRLEREGLLPPTLIVSGYLDPAIVCELQALSEVRGVLGKPFDFAMLEERVSELVQQLAQEGRLEREAGGERVGEPAGSSSSSASSSSGDSCEGDPDDDGWIEILPLSATAPQSGGRQPL